MFKKMFSTGGEEPETPATVPAPAEPAPPADQSGTHSAPGSDAAAVLSAFADELPKDFPNSGRKKNVTHVAQKMYLTPELVKALKRRTYMDDSLDLSGHVRAALEAYLADDLAAVRAGQ